MTDAQTELCESIEDAMRPENVELYKKLCGDPTVKGYVKNICAWCKRVKEAARVEEDLQELFGEGETRTPVLFLCGPAGSGKTYAARWLAEHTALRYGGSTSQFFCEQQGLDIPADKTPEWRAWLAEEIARGNETPPTLYEQMIDQELHIIDGVRRLDELDDAYAYAKREGYRPIKIWIENVHESFDADADPTCLIGLWECQWEIVNDMTPRFENRLAHLCRDEGIPMSGVTWDSKTCSFKERKETS